MSEQLSNEGVVKYSTMIKDISLSTGISFHRTRLIIKESSDVYQDAIKEGKDIDTSIFKIRYTLPGGVIYQNKEVGWDEMEREVYRRTGLPYEEVKVILTHYRLMLEDYVRSGRSVTVKGIGYLYPRELEDGQTDIDYRIAPSLTNLKCDDREFVILGEGTLRVHLFNGEELRLSMGVNLL